MEVPFNKPVLIDGMVDSAMDALQSLRLSGDGAYTKKSEEQLKALTGSANLLTSSCTHALEMMAILLDFSPGDEIILPSFTFVSTANAFVLRGATLRFADCDEFGNISLPEVERLLNPRTKAVMAVHYAGNSCDMRALQKICAKAGVHLLEDAAQALGAQCDNKPLGSFGALGALSFHETKNIGCGEGGSLIVNEAKLLDRAYIIREKGTNRKNFFLGLADKYNWVDVGSSYLMSDLNAAILYPQLLNFGEIQKKRKHIWQSYYSSFDEIAANFGIKILGIPKHNSPNYHIFALLLPSTEHRSKFVSDMKKKGIVTPFHYLSLHQSPYAQKLNGGRTETLLHTERISETLVRLPVFYNMSDAQLDYVISSVQDWMKNF